MGGKPYEFKLSGAQPDAVWAASLRCVSSLGYSVVHTDSTAKVLSFNTGRSMSSWAGQDLTMVLRQDSGFDGTVMTMGGSLGKGGNPFGGGQIVSWGEKGRLIESFAAAIHENLRSAPATSAPAVATSNAAHCVRAS